MELASQKMNREGYEDLYGSTRITVGLESDFPRSYGESRNGLPLIERA